MIARHRALLSLSGLLLLLSGFLQAASLPDFYQEPGFSSSRSYINDSNNEHIDPFTGMLQRHYVDLVVPGNGGMDITINRSYNSMQGTVGSKSIAGVGWNVHFGKIVGDPQKLCSTIFNADVSDNPLIIMPDGSSKLLAYPANFSSLYITADLWKAECINSGNLGLMVTSNTGVQYQFDQYLLNEWYVSSITDLNGNSLQINYKTVGPSNSLMVIDTVIGSDGRSVQFTYKDEASDSARLWKISYDSVIWEYLYQVVPGVSGGHYQLSEVKRPDGLSWMYTYYPYNAAAGAHSINTVTHPYGGTVQYTYALQDFPDGATTSNIYHVIAQKTTGGREVTPGTWTFSFDQDDTRDQTTVIGPDSKIVYKHWGTSSTSTGTVFKTGSLQSKEIFDLSDNLLIKEEYEWAHYPISNEDYYRTSKGGRINNTDSMYVRPHLFTKNITLNGDEFATTYSNLDSYGNTTLITEVSSHGTRQTSLSYYIDETKWIVSLKEDEARWVGGLTGGETIDRTYNANGMLINENKYNHLFEPGNTAGVTTNYTYYSTGDLETVTDANSHTTTFSGYYRGIPQLETKAELKADQTGLITTSRVVNNRGFVTSQTDGRGNTTSYTHNDLGQLTNIDYPINDDTVINWTATGRETTRGTNQYKEVKTFDGFGRLINIKTSDLAQNIVIEKVLQYDALGRTLFESYPNSLISGTNYQYDALGRTKRITHPDTSFTQYNYVASLQVDEINERGFTTSYLYRAFGDPSQKSLIEIRSPKNTTESVNTVMTRDGIDRIQTVTQDGLTRTYYYTLKNFLWAIDNPESGMTVFEYDNVGNVTKKTQGECFYTIFVGGEYVQKSKMNGTIYHYDKLNRLSSVDHKQCSGLVDIFSEDEQDYVTEYKYDDNGNRIYEGKGQLSQKRERWLTYDKNNNLTRETFDYHNYNAVIEYSVNNLDALEAMTYPSGRVITYAPDALGRATQVAPYVSLVSYHDSGLPSTIEYGNGITTSFTFDSRNWIETITAGSLVDLTYDYDFSGNISSITDGVTPANSRSMSYDGLNRLDIANGIWGLGSFEYDDAGNLTSKSLGGTNYTYNYDPVNNRLISVSGPQSYNLAYDSVGHVLSGKGNQYYEYGPDNNLITALTDTGEHYYYYDARNLKSRKDLGNIYLYSNSDNLIGEYQFKVPVNDTATAEAWVKEYYYLGSMQVAMAERTPSLAPSAVASLSVPQTDDGNGNYTLNWSAASGEVHWYTVEESTNGVNGFNSIYRGQDISLDINAQPDGTYYYRIKACNLDYCSMYTMGSNPVSVVKFLTETPTISSPSSDFDGLYEVALGSISGTVTYYEIEMATVSDFSDGSLLHSGPSLSKIISGQAEGVYYYRGRACNVRGCTAYSPETSTSVEFPTVAPTVIAPADVTIEATGPLTTVLLGTASAYDDKQTLEVSPDDIGPFEVGVHTITWTSSNVIGTITATQIITVLDTTAPTFTSIPYQYYDTLAYEATGPMTDIDWLQSEPAIAEDIVDGTTSIWPDKLGPFTVGSHIVTWTATDSSGNSNSFTKTIIIQDTVPPEIGISHIRLSSDVLIAVDLGSPVVTDLVGVSEYTNDAPEFFSSGTTAVRWSATDVSGNTSFRYQYVTVEKTIPDFHWGNSVKIPGLTQGDHNPDLVSNDDGSLMMAAWQEHSVNSVGGFQISIMISEYKSSTGWSKPYSIHSYSVSTPDDYLMQPAIAMSPNGKAIVAVENLSAPFNTETFVLFYEPSTGWSSVEVRPHGFSTFVDGEVVIFNSGEAILFSQQERETVPVYSDVIIARHYSPSSGWFDDKMLCAGELGAPNEYGETENIPDELGYDEWSALYLHVDSNGIDQAVVSLGESYNSPHPAVQKYDTNSGWSSCKKTDTTFISSDRRGSSPLRMNSNGIYGYISRYIDIISSEGVFDNPNGGVFDLQSSPIPFHSPSNPMQMAAVGHSVDVKFDDTIQFLVGQVDFGYCHCSEPEDRDNSIWLVQQNQLNFLFETPIFPDNNRRYFNSYQRFYRQEQSANIVSDSALRELAIGWDQNFVMKFNFKTPENGWYGDRTVPGITGYPEWSYQDVEFFNKNNIYYYFFKRDGEFYLKKFGTGDISPPQITLPPDVVVDSTGDFTSVSLGSATAIDDIDGVVAVSHENIGPLPVGHHYVIWTSVDSAGNVATDLQKVTVRDTVPPVVSAPANLVVEAESIYTYVDLGQGSANDNWDGALIPTPDQQGPFTVGIHTITWSAVDSFGNVGTATQTVEVRDSIAPQLTIPADLTVTSPDGQPITVDIGQATATDIFAVSITNDAPAMFAVGSTSVNWVAVDENGQQSTAVQNVTINPPPGWPVTVAGDDQYVAPGVRVTLDGSLSYDSDGGSISSYSWNQLSGPTARLRKPDNVSTSFTAPDVTVTTELIFELMVTDNSGNSNYDRVSVFVEVNTPNNPPTANAGIDQTTTEGELVSLDGQLSADNDGSIISFSWQQISGPVVSLSGANTSVATFTAPDVTSSTVLSFELTVTDDQGETDTDTVLITVNNTPSGNLSPTANAGADQVVIEGYAVMLNGQLSSDSDGSISSYNWVQLSGPVVSLTSAGTAIASFNAPFVSSSTALTFELTVTDDQGAIDTDTVVVTVNDSGGGDSTPPVTSISYTSTSSKGNTFYDVSLQADEQATTSYRVTSGTILSGGTDTSNWQTYTGTINIRAPKKGNTVIEFYSQDSAGNTETAQSVVLN